MWQSGLRHWTLMRLQVKGRDRSPNQSGLPPGPGHFAPGMLVTSVHQWSLPAIVSVCQLVWAPKRLSTQGSGFSSGHVRMWESDCKESWAPKNWCFGTVVLEKTLESPLGCKEIQPVHPKGDQSQVFVEGTDVEGETPILWPPDAKSWLIGKGPDAGKDWGQEEKGNDRGWDGWMASPTL